VIRRDYRAFLEFFYGNMFPEPHSTKQVEDAVAYGLDGPVEVLLMAQAEPVAETREQVEEICRRVRCPVLVVQGDHDNCQNFATGLALAELTDAEHVRIEGGGHIPGARHPVLVNRLIHDFAARFERPQPCGRTWVPAGGRTRRAVLLSSPIGLGHVWRDVALARELRRLVPDLEIHWLAQPPVTTLLDACGETIHPASAELAPEAAGVDAEAGEHELHAFQMLRRLDEIFCANFMVFHDLVREEPFDLWIADEAWEVDYFLHENPELKTAPYVWLTDFVGVVPMADGDEREAYLAADWNAQMVEHVARNPRVRDLSIFIGDPDDIVPERFGPNLPTIREWTERHFRFTGYITGFEQDEIANRAALRAEFGYEPDEKVCIVAAGGSAVGIHLMQRAAAAFPDAKRRIPQLRMIIVTGPRIGRDALPHGDGLETHGYVHRLYRQLAACDLAVSHGGLSTTMELTAAGRPFIFFPLRSHFEQNHHVAHRLTRHGAGRRMDFAATGTADLATAIAEEIDRTPRYRPVAQHGARQAAEAFSELLR
jgi:UDP-N-acetylglucosamine:LPS N-acetylglucosamine transferase